MHIYNSFFLKNWDRGWQKKTERTWTNYRRRVWKISRSERRHRIPRFLSSSMQDCRVLNHFRIKLQNYYLIIKWHNFVMLYVTLFSFTILDYNLSGNSMKNLEIRRLNFQQPRIWRRIQFTCIFLSLTYMYT